MRDQFAYVAGLFDGDGCVGVYHSKGGVSLQVTITQTDNGLLERVREIVGFGSVNTKSRATRTRQAAKQYVCYSQKALKLLTLIRPFVWLKGERIDCAVRCWRDRVPTPKQSEVLAAAR